MAPIFPRVCQKLPTSLLPTTYGDAIKSKLIRNLEGKLTTGSKTENIVALANRLNHSLREINNELWQTPASDQRSTFPKRYAYALLGESQAAIHQITLERLSDGKRRFISENVLEAIKLLEQAGPEYDAITTKLVHLIGDLPALGIAVDGVELFDSHHKSRITR